MSYVYTEASKKARMKYQKEKLRRVPFDLFHKDYELLKEQADAAGDSISGYIKKAISSYSGQAFSWDGKDFPMNTPEQDDTPAEM